MPHDSDLSHRTTAPDEGAASFGPKPGQASLFRFQPREPDVTDDVRKDYRELCYYARGSRNPDRVQPFGLEAASELLALLEEVSRLRARAAR